MIQKNTKAAKDQDKLPKIFYVNWFRKDENNKDLPGGFMWPGYGDNSRVLAWIFDRCDGKDNAVDTPIGDVREVYDLVIMRGKWTDQDRSKQVSNAYNEFLEFSNQITALDEFVGSAISSGKSRPLLPTGRDINQEAHYILTRGAQDLVLIAKYLKLLIDDCTNPKAELLINWKEVERAAESPIKNMMAAVYKKIYLFVSLMQIYLTEGKNV